jgi:hypothetical protein
VSESKGEKGRGGERERVLPRKKGRSAKKRSEEGRRTNTSESEGREDRVLNLEFGMISHVTGV